MFFTPAGEEHWVPGWKPRYVWPATGQTRQGMVFTTGQDAEHTVWTLVEFDRSRRRSCYARTTGTDRTALVRIHVMPLEPNSCEVSVGYEVTALKASASDPIRAYQGSAFVEMIEGWRSKIMDALPNLQAATIM